MRTSSVVIVLFGMKVPEAGISAQWHKPRVANIEFKSVLVKARLHCRALWDEQRRRASTTWYKFISAGPLMVVPTSCTDLAVGACIQTRGYSFHPHVRTYMYILSNLFRQSVHAFKGRLKHGIVHLYTVWVKIFLHPRLFEIISQRLRILKHNFTPLLYVKVYVKLSNFIQLSLIMTKLWYIKRHYPRVKFYISSKTRKIAIPLCRYDRSPQNLAQWCRMGLSTISTVTNEFYQTKMADNWCLKWWPSIILDFLKSKF